MHAQDDNEDPQTISVSATDPSANEVPSVQTPFQRAKQELSVLKQSSSIIEPSKAQELSVEPDADTADTEPPEGIEETSGLPEELSAEEPRVPAPDGGSSFCDGCSLGGTCYEELNRCDCPPFTFGEKNPNNPCSKVLMPACEMAPGLVSPCGRGTCSPSFHNVLESTIPNSLAPLTSRMF